VQFIRFLSRTVEGRKRIFEETNVADFTEYRNNRNNRKHHHAMPAIIVMIDAYASFADVYEDVSDRLTLFVRDAFRYGIYVVITALTTHDLRYKLSTNFKMAVALELIDKNYSEIVGRTEGLEPESFCGRGLVKLEKPLEFQAALPGYRKVGEIIHLRKIVESIAANETRRAAPIPVMPDRIAFKTLNVSKNEFIIGMSDSEIVPVSVNFADYVSFIISGNPGSGKSTLATVWLNNLPDALIYAVDSSSAGFINIMENENVIDLANMDIDDFVSTFEETLNERRNRLNEARKRRQDVPEVVNAWQQIIFAFDKFSEVSDEDNYYDLMKLLTRIIKKEYGLKVMILALDSLDAFGDDYSDVGKAMKNEQTGLLLGSLKEQSLFGVSLPYGESEKHLAFGDGYLIRKSRYVGIRAAL